MASDPELFSCVCWPFVFIFWNILFMSFAHSYLIVCFCCSCLFLLLSFLNSLYILWDISPFLDGQFLQMFPHVVSVASSLCEFFSFAEQELLSWICKVWLPLSVFLRLNPRSLTMFSDFKCFFCIPSGNLMASCLRCRSLIHFELIFCCAV